MRKGQLKYDLEDMKELALSRGYSFTSPKYFGINKMYNWKCKLGHPFTTTPTSFKAGTKCPICSRRESGGEKICRKYFEAYFKSKFPKNKPEWLRNSRGNLMELDGYNEKLKIAFEYNGQQHYDSIRFFGFDMDKYVPQRKEDDKKKKEVCKQKGITLFEIPFFISKKNMGHFIISEAKKKGIKINSILATFDYQILDLDGEDMLAKMQLLAKERNGKCLAKNYVNARTIYPWSCNICGHKWNASWDNAQRYWCKRCADARGKKKLMHSIEHIQKVAESRGFTLLSKKYLGARKLHRYQCKKRHEWNATPDNINRGKGCPYCFGKYKTLADMNSIAKKKGGKCLSTKYINCKIHLEWECKNGHRWKAVPDSIQRGTWCPICYRNKRKLKKSS